METGLETYKKASFLKKMSKNILDKVENRLHIVPADDEQKELLKNIYEAKQEWENANINFDYVCEEELVDYYAYKIRASQSKYEYLLKQAKEKGLNALL